MLVLSRQRDETIMIGDDIEITVVDIRGDKVRLGISAPTRISVHRKEIYEAIKAENQKASQITNSDLPTLRDSPGSGPQRLRTRATGGLPPPSRVRPAGPPPPPPSPGTAYGGAKSA